MIEEFVRWTSRASIPNKVKMEALGDEVQSLVSMIVAAAVAAVLAGGGAIN
jgi:hypothetical protein